MSIEIINNRYQLIDQLGQGGMGVVSTALDRLTRHTVALKQVTIPGEQLQFSTMGDSHDYRLALAQEFRTLSSLRHPHIISVLDYGFDVQRQPFFTMELLGEAEDIVTAGRDQPLGVQLEYLIQTLQALSYLYRRGIIHRDLKPGNVMVTDGQVKVLDFGLSIAREHLKDRYEGQITGTLAYMAPEVLQGYPASEASDLYAVGIIAWELLSGQYPFDASSYSELVDMILDHTPDIYGLDIDYRLQAVLERLLAKNPADRYASADEVIAIYARATGQQERYETAAIRESFLQAAQFIGRDTELQQLTDGLAEAVEGSGSAWLIGGESGIGKSRLMDELRTNSLVEGAIVLRGQGAEGGGLPYQLWRNAVRRLALSTELSDLEASVLKEIAPDIGSLLDRDILDAPLLESEAQQQRLVVTIANLFRRQQQPVVLLLEDLQWAIESLEPLKLLNQQINELPLLIVGNYRDDERPDLPDELPGMKVMPLARLSQTEITQLSTSMLGITGEDPNLVDLLQKETEGNVFFLVEVVRTLAEDAGRLSDIGKTSLPQKVFAGGIQQVVRRRLQRLPDWGQTMLQLAAIAGRKLDLNILAPIASEVLPRHALDQWLQAGAEATIIELQDEQWRFNHDKLREAILDDLDEQQQSHLYRQVAEAIEATYPDDSAYAAMLAEHWHMVGDTARETRYALIAAEQLIATSAFTEAQTLLARNLQHPDTQPEQRTRLLQLLGEIAYWLSDYSQAVDLYQQALDLARQLDDQSMIAGISRSLGVTWSLRGDHARAQEYTEHSLVIYRQIDDQKGIGQCLKSLGIVIQRRGDYPVAQDYFQRSLLIAQQSEDQIEIGDTLYSLGVNAIRLGNYPAAIDYLHESRAIYDALGHRLGASQCLNALGAATLEMQDLNAAREYIQRSMELAYEVGNRSGIAYALGNLGYIAYEQKDYLLAEDYFWQALVIQRQIGRLDGIVIALFNLGDTAHIRGDYLAARDYFRQGLETARRLEHKEWVVSSLTGIARASVELGDLEDARPQVHEGLTILHNAKITPTLLIVMVGVVTWLFRSQQTRRAAELAGLTANHPKADLDTRTKVEALYPEMEAELGAEAFTVALEHGKTLDLDQVVAQLLEELAQ